MLERRSSNETLNVLRKGPEDGQLQNLKPFGLISEQGRDDNALPVTFVPVTAEAIEELRGLNTVLFPMTYQDKYYKEVLAPDALARISMIVYFLLLYDLCDRSLLEGNRCGLLFMSHTGLSPPGMAQIGELYYDIWGAGALQTIGNR